MVNYFKRVYSVAEFRTGFVAGSCGLLGVSFGIYMTDQLQPLLAVLIVISSFCFNIVANVAAEISGFIGQEDISHQTGHSGSEGLVRGDASLFDAWSALLLFSLIAIGSGLLAVLISDKLILLVLGGIGFLIAIGYSLTPVSLNKYPISEIISGLMCGSFCFIAGAIIYLPLSLAMILFSLIPLIMVDFLMATNNTTDYQKDLGIRTTFPHLIGFENSIRILQPLIVLIYFIWIFLACAVLKSIILLVVGLLILTYCGLYKWYLPYRKVHIETEDLSRIYGPLPLILLLPFNFIISIILIILR